MLPRTRLNLSLAVLLLLAGPLPLEARGGDTPSLERRVKRLESTVRKLRERIRSLEEELKRLRSQAPGTADTRPVSGGSEGGDDVRHAADDDGPGTSTDVPGGSDRLTRDRFRRVQPSMRPNAVRNLLGPPDRIERGNYPSLLAALQGRGRVVRWFYRRRVDGSTVRAGVVFRNRRVQDKTWRSTVEPSD